MRIAVFGAGAIGSLFGGLLSRSHRVLLIGRAPHVEAIRREGLCIRSGAEESVFQPEASVHLPVDERFDLVGVAVKAHHLETACKTLAGLRHPPPTIACLQNGIGNEEVMARYFRPRQIVRAVIYEGATLRSPGRIDRSGRGITFVGRPLLPGAGNPGKELEELAQTWTEDQFATKVSRDIQREIWRKLIVNAAINPLGALAGVPNGALVRSPYLRGMLRAVTEECEAVALAEQGYEFHLAEKAEEIAQRTGRNRNSMLLDLESGRQTEIGFLNSRILRFAKRHNIPVPANEYLVRLIKRMENRIRTGMLPSG